MQSLKNNLVLVIIAICIFTSNSYTFSKMISNKNTFSCNKKCNTCVFNSFRSFPNNKNFTDISKTKEEEEDENVIFVQEGEIDIMD